MLCQVGGHFLRRFIIQSGKYQVRTENVYGKKIDVAFLNIYNHLERLSVRFESRTQL